MSRDGVVTFADDPYATLVAAGTHKPQLVVLESGLMRRVDLSTYVKTLARALPESRIVMIGARSGARVPRGVSVFRDFEGLAQALDEE
jgi:hypothetical protein